VHFTTLLLTLIRAALAVPAAFAGGSPHFINNATKSSLSGITLIGTFEEAGLSAGSIETITCSATESVTHECVNGGGKNPSASNKTTFQTSGSSRRVGEPRRSVVRQPVGA
jgi:hypothetical protein